jgi:hypothetical protein
MWVGGVAALSWLVGKVGVELMVCSSLLFISTVVIYDVKYGVVDTFPCYLRAGLLLAIRIISIVSFTLPYMCPVFNMHYVYVEVSLLYCITRMCTVYLCWKICHIWPMALHLQGRRLSQARSRW